MDDGVRFEATQGEYKETGRLCYAITFILIGFISSKLRSQMQECPPCGELNC
jgi:hypothetical protein